jgi:hypothetical protein
MQHACTTCTEHLLTGHHRSNRSQVNSCFFTLTPQLCLALDVDCATSDASHQATARGICLLRPTLTYDVLCSVWNWLLRVMKFVVSYVFLCMSFFRAQPHRYTGLVLMHYATHSYARYIAVTCVAIWLSDVDVTQLFLSCMQQCKAQKWHENQACELSRHLQNSLQ